MGDFMTEIKKEIYSVFQISDETRLLAEEIENNLRDKFEKLEEVKMINQMKVLQAMQGANLSDSHFNSTTGYGYNDSGREKTEEIYSKVFSCEDALVRPGIVNGTHALSICLNAILRPNDTMLSISGKPYDTLDDVIGITESDLSLKDYGIEYKQIDLNNDGSFNEDEILNQIINYKSKIKMVYIQRSKGYSERNSLTVDQIGAITKKIKEIDRNIVVMVDNCYGEFIEEKEPTEVFVDIMAGSLIKNPGGGLAISGGYICGKKKLVEMCSKKLTANSIGKECGLTFNTNRLTLQGLFLAPSVVNSALKGAIFASMLFEKAGYKVFPKPQDHRSDIIQGIRLESEESLVAFCQGIQKACPVDSYVTPVPAATPGYSDKVIMASGAFIQGSSIELSADGPIREPYNVYFQGGLTYEHSKLGALLAFEHVIHKKK